MNPANNTQKKMWKETFKEVNSIFPRSPNTSDWESGVLGLTVRRIRTLLCNDYCIQLSEVIYITDT